MIYLVRHGEAAASWGDHPDPGLSELGLQQAVAVADELVSRGATSAVTSPMRRCRETSVPFLRAVGIEAPVVPQVSEIVTPEGVGDRVTWLRGFMAGTWAVEGRDHTTWRDDMLKRIGALPDGAVVFTHFVAINAIASTLMQRPETIIFKPGHCSITTLSREGGQLKVQELGSESATRVL